MKGPPLISFVITKTRGGEGFALGDFLAYGEGTYRDKNLRVRVPDGIYEEIAKVTGYSEKTLRNAKAVCAALPPEKRTPDLCFGHASEIVFGVPEDKRQRWIQLTLARKWSVKELRKRVKKTYP